MVYETLVKLPHEWFIGEINFVHIPIMGELVELTPRASFKVTEMNNKEKKLTLRFEVIFHDSNIKNILLREMSFRNVWD